MSEERTIREGMLDDLLDDEDGSPDAAVLVTIDDLDEEAEPTLSLYAQHDDPELEKLARRKLAEDAASMLAKHFPNETKHGAVQVAGGRFTAKGGFRSPRRDWERHHEDDEEGEA